MEDIDKKAEDCKYFHKCFVNIKGQCSDELANQCPGYEKVSFNIKEHQE